MSFPLIRTKCGISQPSKILKTSLYRLNTRGNLLKTDVLHNIPRNHIRFYSGKKWKNPVHKETASMRITTGSHGPESHRIVNSNYSLPQPYEDQAFVKVSALEGGFVSVRLKLMIEDAPDDNERKLTPILAFLLEHSKTGKKFLFDLGARKNLETLPLIIRDAVRMKFPLYVPQSVEESLEKGGMNPKDIDLVILSHLHADHFGDSASFPNAVFHVGQESRKLLEYKSPTGTMFVLPPERTKFIPDSALNHSIGPFPRAMDFFGDGSVYIVDAAGHAPGHINLLARTSADGAWICLTGDSAHDPRVIRGEKNIPTKILEEGVFKGNTGIYEDLEKALEHIERLRSLHKMAKVHVLTPHDYEWYDVNRGGSSFFPGRIPPFA